MASSSSDSLSATPRGLGASGLLVVQIPEFPLKLVRSVEITANFHRCKKYFEKFCGAGAFEGTGEKLYHRGHRGPLGNLNLFPGYLSQSLPSTMRLYRRSQFGTTVKRF